MRVRTIVIGAGLLAIGTGIAWYVVKRRSAAWLPAHQVAGLPIPCPGTVQTFRQIHSPAGVHNEVNALTGEVRGPQAHLITWGPCYTLSERDYKAQVKAAEAIAKANKPGALAQFTGVVGAFGGLIDAVIPG